MDEHDKSNNNDDVRKYLSLDLAVCVGVIAELIVHGLLALSRIFIATTASMIGYDMMRYGERVSSGMRRSI